MRFEEFDIEDGTLDAIVAMGYEEPTPIQEQSIGPMLAGRDVVGQAQTGTGKTAAFGIPIVDRYRYEKNDHVYALVILPTRELALQVTEAMEEMARGSKLKIIPVYGGTGFGKQTHALGLSGPKIVVATPGRLLDLYGQGKIRLDKVGMVVLDEADRMLDMGFINDMRKVMDMVPESRQTALYSATIDQRIKGLLNDFTTNPVIVKVKTPTVTTDLTEQFMHTVDKSGKRDVLLRYLQTHNPQRGIVFTRTKHLAKRLAQQLAKCGWSSVALQGNMTQPQRERAMEAFRNGDVRLMVATDVAARGLDVPEVDHVVNFDIPDDPEQYVHRIGRTGRNGRTGQSLTLVEPNQKKDYMVIERLAGSKPKSYEVEDIEIEQGPDAYVDPATRGMTPKQIETRQQSQNSGARGGGGHRNRNHGRKRAQQSNQGRQHGQGRKKGNNNAGARARTRV